MFHGAHGIGFFRWSGLLCPPWVPIGWVGMGVTLTGCLLYCLTLDLSGGSDGKEFACNVGDLGWISESGRFPWRRKWQPTPVFLPEESHEQRSQVGYRPWGHNESDTTERLSHSFIHYLRCQRLVYEDIRTGWSVWNGMWWAGYFWVINVMVHDVLSGPNKGFLFNDK